MIEHGWKHFDTRVAMYEAAQPYDTSEDMKGLIFTEGYTIGQ
jgi:hypothetical protein